MEQKVAAIVLNYNSSEDVRKCLSYLRKQKDVDLNLIVVDNASPNLGEIDKLKEICHSVGADFIANGSNEGFSAGNNIGLRRAVENGAEWCLVINPDVEIRDELYIAETLATSTNYKEAVVIGTNTIAPGGVRQNPLREATYLEELLWPLETIKSKLGKWKGYIAEDKTGYCAKVSGCCFFINCNFLKQINYLDSNVFMYCEEPILAKQVEKAGYRELYIKELTAFHEHYATEKGSNANRMRLFLESRKYYIKNYSGYSGWKRALLLMSKDIQKMYWIRRG